MKPGYRCFIAALLLHSGVAICATTRYVSIESTNAVAPYFDWATAATNIQDAVDVAEVGDLILVADGIYRSGGKMYSGGASNRLVVTKGLMVRSVNGPAVTAIEGSRAAGTNAVRCAYLMSGAKLVGFTLTNGAANQGGGVYWDMNSYVPGVVSNCVLAGNLAFSSGGGVYRASVFNSHLSGNTAYSGGGACGSILSNCSLVANSAERGGGASECEINSCVLTGNSATIGGGAEGGKAVNCLVLSNYARSGGGLAYAGGIVNCTVVSNFAEFGGGVLTGNWVDNSILYYNTATVSHPDFVSASGSGGLDHCCSPLPAPGVGSFTNVPMFLDLANGNLRLQSNSPCINSARNGWIKQATDLDGNPRFVAATSDVGAYEFQAPASAISYIWLEQYGMPADGTTDAADPDNDGMNNWQEWMAGTDPTSDQSTLRLLSIEPAVGGIRLKWSNRPWSVYYVDRATNLAASTGFVLLASNIFGGYFTDTNVIDGRSFYYRVGVRPL